MFGHVAVHSVRTAKPKGDQAHATAWSRSSSMQYCKGPSPNACMRTGAAGPPSNVQPPSPSEPLLLLPPPPAPRPRNTLPPCSNGTLHAPNGRKPHASTIHTCARSVIIRRYEHGRYHLQAGQGLPPRPRPPKHGRTPHPTAATAAAGPVPPPQQRLQPRPGPGPGPCSWQTRPAASRPPAAATPCAPPAPPRPPRAPRGPPAAAPPRPPRPPGARSRPAVQYRNVCGTVQQQVRQGKGLGRAVRTGVAAAQKVGCSPIGTTIL